ncbi:MAG: KUP/HAK/KT family potassium transporter, partial [Paracoccaceae bacterium]
LLPRLEILHTSKSQMGQIYLPRVNAILATGVILLVIIFGSSSNLASAYGIAVTGDMVITSILASILFVKAWNWSLTKMLAIMVPLLTLELLFLAANGTKILDGGYVPILMAFAMCAMMWTWLRGTAHVQMRARRGATETSALVAMLAKSSRLVDVPGTAIFLTSDPEVAPAALMHNIKHNHVLHAQNMIVTVTVATVPYIANADRVTIEPMGERFLKIDLAFGYMEEPNVPKALALARKQGLKFDIMSTSFFLNRRTFRSDPAQGLPAWQEKLFVGMAKSAADVTGFYRLPTNRVVEMGQQVVI